MPIAKDDIREILVGDLGEADSNEGKLILEIYEICLEDFSEDDLGEETEEVHRKVMIL